MTLFQTNNCLQASENKVFKKLFLLLSLIIHKYNIYIFLIKSLMFLQPSR
jgi:hypothetical protein